MNISFLETFYWLGTLRSVSDTARRLGISQPVVSMRMAALQKALGLELYRGSGRNFELTNAGRRVLSKCEGIMLLSKELEDEARQAVSAATTGYVGVAEVIGLTWLPEFLENMRTQHPNLHIGLRTGLLADVLAALDEGNIDVALVVGPNTNPAMISDPICEYDVKWLGALELLTNKPKMDILDLARIPIIRPQRNSYRYEKMVEYFRWHNLEDTGAFQPRHWIDVGFGLMTCAHLASRAVGATALPAAVAIDYLRDDRLSVLNVQQEFLPWQIVAIRKRNANLQIVEPVINAAKSAVAKFALRDGVGPHFRATFD